MGFLASGGEVGESTAQTDMEGKYLISFPRSFIEESPETTIETQVFINDKEDNDSWIFGESPAEKQTNEIKAEEKLICFDFTLPKNKESKGLLNIKVHFKDSTCSVNSFEEITILKKENYPLIQTDKGPRPRQRIDAARM